MTLTISLIVLFFISVLHSFMFIGVMLNKYASYKHKFTASIKTTVAWTIFYALHLF
jgi:hypothetical protein